MDIIPRKSHFLHALGTQKRMALIWTSLAVVYIAGLLVWSVLHT